MPSHDNHGLRRAIFSRTSSKGRRRAASSPVPRPRGRGQKLAVAAAVMGMIGMTVLSTAHAAPTGILAMGEVPASAVAAPAAQPSLLADAGSSLVFDQPQVKSSPAAKAAAKSARKAAPKAAPKAARKAASKPARKPALKAAPKPVRKPAPKPARASAPSAGLRAPLASTIVTSPFGHRVNPLTGAMGELHTGLDFAGACGTPVLAAARGKVTEAGWSPYGGGNRIVVDHGKGLKTTYNHLASIGVSKGQTLAQGGRIAAVGTTGSSTGCHLHFEVMVNNRTVNPASYL